MRKDICRVSVAAVGIMTASKTAVALHRHRVLQAQLKPIAPQPGVEIEALTPDRRKEARVAQSRSSRPKQADGEITYR